MKIYDFVQYEEVQKGNQKTKNLGRYTIYAHINLYTGFTRYPLKKFLHKEEYESILLSKL